MGHAHVNIGVLVDFTKLPKDTGEARRILYKKALEQLSEWEPENPPNGSSISYSTTPRVDGMILSKETEDHYKSQGVNVEDL